MKHLLLLLALVSAGSTPGPGAISPPKHLPAAADGHEWRLVWSDEFDGKKLDETRWDVPEQKRRDATWSRRAVALDGKGHLVIRTMEEKGKYYDACVRTKRKFERAFGYFECRCRFQSQPGHWTAFWMYGKGVTTVGDDGRDGTEIDIMEKPWLDDRVQQTLHWDGYGKQHRTKGKVVKVPGVMKGFHTFGLLWTPEEYVFFVDGKETWRTRAGGVCQVPLYLKLSDELQLKGWAGDVREAKLPDEFVVDYVRVFDLVDAASGKRVYRPK